MPACTAAVSVCLLYLSENKLAMSFPPQVAQCKTGPTFPTTTDGRMRSVGGGGRPAAMGGDFILKKMISRMIIYDVLFIILFREFETQNISAR